MGLGYVTRIPPYQELMWRMVEVVEGVGLGRVRQGVRRDEEHRAHGGEGRRGAQRARGDGGPPGPEGDRGGAEHVADQGGRRVNAGHVDRGGGQRKRERGVALVRERAERRDVDQPEQDERAGRDEPAVHGGQRRARRGGEGGHPFHPFATASMPPARASRSRNMTLISGGAATNRTIRPWITWAMSVGT